MKYKNLVWIIVVMLCICFYGCDNNVNIDSSIDEVLTSELQITDTIELIETTSTGVTEEINHTDLGTNEVEDVSNAAVIDKSDEYAELKSLLFTEVENQKDKLINSALANVMDADFVRQQAEKRVYPELADKIDVNSEQDVIKVDMFSVEIYDTGKTLVSIKLNKVNLQEVYEYEVIGVDKGVYFSGTANFSTGMYTLILDIILPYVKYDVKVTDSQNNVYTFSTIPVIASASEEYVKEVVGNLITELSGLTTEEQFIEFAAKCKPFLARNRYEVAPTFEYVLEMLNNGSTTSETVLEAVAEYDFVSNYVSVEEVDDLGSKIDSAKVDEYIKSEKLKGELPEYYVKMFDRWALDTDLCVSGELVLQCWDYVPQFIPSNITEVVTINKSFNMIDFSLSGDEVVANFSNSDNTILLKTKSNSKGENLVITCVINTLG